MSVVLNIVSTTLISVNLCRIMTYFVSMKLKLTNMIQSIWMGILLFHNVEDRSFFRKSGGIGVFVKNDLLPYVNLIESDSDYILWFKLNKKFTQIDQDIIFGAVYLPPSDSRFNTPDELENFEIEITNMCVSQKYVIMMGDFNSRTGNKQDFLDADNFLADLFHFDDAMQQFFDISSILEQYQFSKHRKSKDSVVNNEG